VRTYNFTIPSLVAVPKRTYTSRWLAAVEPSGSHLDFYSEGQKGLEIWGFAGTIWSIIFLNITPSILVDVYSRFGGTNSLLQGESVWLWNVNSLIMARSSCKAVSGCLFRITKKPVNGRRIRVLCYGRIPPPRKRNKHTNGLANILVAWVLRKTNKLNGMAEMPKIECLPEFTHMLVIWGIRFVQS
jgi:hypothetical protein